MTILFTGERRDRHFLVKVNDKKVWLPIALFRLLLQLVAARATSYPGFVKAARLKIHRLRHAIDDAVGAGAGKRLVGSGDREEYYVTIPQARASADQCLDPTFSDLFDHKIIRREEIAAWLTASEKSAPEKQNRRKTAETKVKPAETGKKHRIH